jgi:hypothetical protein
MSSCNYGSFVEISAQTRAYPLNTKRSCPKCGLWGSFRNGRHINGHSQGILEEAEFFVGQLDLVPLVGRNSVYAATARHIWWLCSNDTTVIPRHVRTLRNRGLVLSAARGSSISTLVVVMRALSIRTKGAVIHRGGSLEWAQ